MMDKYFRVEVVAKTASPQQACWVGMHQCVCEGVAIDDEIPDEAKAGESVVKHLLAGNRGHYSPLEAPQITFNVAGFPHSVMQQATRHRVAVHFSVQSFRYTGQRIYKVGKDIAEFIESSDVSDSYDKSLLLSLLSHRYPSHPITDAIESVFYLRPVGHYTDRQGAKYEYTEAWRNEDLVSVAMGALKYYSDISRGKSEEHARGLIPFDVRQHFVVSFNARSLMHFLDLRSPANAQLEITQLCELIWPHFEAWMPEVAGWYKKNRYGKARLAP